MNKKLEKNTQHRDYRQEIAEIVGSNLTPKLMRSRILDYHENDIAGVLELLKKDARRRLYSILDTGTLANVLSYAEPFDGYMEELSVKKRVEVLSQMDVALTIEYLRRLDKPGRDMLLDLMAEDVKGELTMLSAFDEDEIGRKMTTNYVAIPAGLGVRQAMRELIAQAAENDNISTLYVVDEEETLVGAIDLKDLIVAREGTNIDAITMTSYPYVYAGEQIEDCIERIKDYSEDSIPVLDNNNRLRGVLSFGAIGLYLAACKGQTWTLVWGISFCTGAAQLVAMLLSSVTGTVIPILFKKLGIDPAVASGPLITTVNDLVAVTAYYGLAWGLLIGVMGL